MRNYDAIAAALGYDLKIYNPPEIAYKYFAYKDGVSHKCDTESEAKKISKNIEKVNIPESKKAYEDYWIERKKQDNIVYEFWYRELREEYSHASDKVFELCYNKAYDIGHNSGYDEVANSMSGIVDFAHDIIDAVKDSM